ncbi:subtilisin-like protease SBT1.1 [Cucurbita maxima]|uniref:Subtilisin-like protease SBT1.1 n=1 Tax=Cucurbita maxima TaxID=3661 RepID=A0A6J1JPC3_CUCMA|nr:subtilisin-like protease SBT1.1 [Cucurbita maxima]XP_022990948.1 subtilisin-like protease SBT1.1 [Cucurbita maxima]
MGFREVCLFLSIFLATSAAAVDQQSYIIHMDTTKMAAPSPEQWYTALIDSINKISSLDDQEEASSAAQILYVYKTAISGFAAKLSTKKLHSLSKTPGFLAATPNELLQLHTTHSPQFLGLQREHGLWNSSNLASDIVIGLLDTGIWPEHISFQDKGLPPVPKKWKGTCQAGQKFSPSNCNRKLIGATAYIKGYEAIVGRLNATGTFRSPRDSDGHGTHTASTAAGNIVNKASFFNQAMGVATGMRFTSRIAAYKVCWTEGCANADILAAIDRAVADGVDVLSLSLGGSASAFYKDDIAIATFGAVRNGVFVSCSAGNSGPSSSTVSNIAPWIMTVAASYTDRTFPATVKLGNGQVFEGSSLYSGNSIGQLPLVYNNTAGGEEANVCTAGSLVPSLVKGKIVVCERGTNSRTAKGEQVKLAGGAGMILINTQLEGEELFADPHVLPAANLGASAGQAIIRYISSSKHQPKALIAFEGTKFGNRAPRVAAFSSRGPSLIAPDVIKPDVTAPGVNILAAWPLIASPSELESDKRRVLFNIISGTSMSCPHVSGLAALLKSAHKDWSPAAIKSALMTTAYTNDNRMSPISDVGSESGKPANPFAFGSGHVDPEKASDPGLIYDITPQDYLNYFCSLNYNSTQIGLVSRGNFTCPSKRRVGQPGNLNYPSFSVFMKKKAKNVSVTLKRTVTNVGRPRSDYTVKIKNPKGIGIRVEPEKLSFRRYGQKLSYQVSFVALGKREGLGGFSFGSLVWVSGKYGVRSPIAVTWK